MGGMKPFLRAAALLLIGVSAGVALERSWTSSQPHPAPLPEPSLDAGHEAAKTRLRELTEREFAEYLELKGLRERYEKADELLGKVLLVLIADLGLRVSDKHAQAIREAARGNHRPARDNPETGRPHSLPPTPQTPATRPTEPPPQDARTAPLPPARPPEGHVPFDRLEARSRRNCERERPGWHILSESPSGDYRIGFDPALSSSQEQVAFIRSATDNPRSRAELAHCADMSAVSGKRVRFTALIKADSVRDRASLQVRAHDQNRSPIAREVARFRGTFDWKPLTVELDIPAAATTALYGIAFEGEGKAWIRHPSFQVLGLIPPTSGQ
jgi:hypothetical protein